MEGLSNYEQVKVAQMTNRRTSGTAIAGLVLGTAGVIAAMGVIDTIYIKVYETLCRPEDTDTAAASNSAGDRSDTGRAVSGVRKRNKPKNN